jgi:hypothetical protein
LTDVVGGLQTELSNLLSGSGAIGNGIFNALPPGAQDLIMALDGFIGTPFIFNGIQQVGVTAAWFIFAAIPNAILGQHTAASLAASAAEAAAPAAAAAEGAAAGWPVRSDRRVQRPA